MQWSSQQDEALRRVSEWLHRRDQQVFSLQGYAGTGKTTLAKYFSQDVLGEVLFGAYTGKATSMLRRRGCLGAMTTHQMIYNPKAKSRKRLHELQLKLDQALADRDSTETLDPTATASLEAAIAREEKSLKKPAFELNENAPIRDASLVVIDEGSMINEYMGKHLMSFGVPILVLSDPAQLPPVHGNPFFTKRADYLLTDIHRQAADNPIIHLATLARLGKPLPLGNYGTSMVIDRKPRVEEVLIADQILVGKNITRTTKNSRMRTLLGHTDGPFPVAGERLICLRNDHEAGLQNGSIWLVDQVLGTGHETIEFELTDEVGNQLEVNAHTHHFEGRENELSYWVKREAQEFDYGYAITTHKSQGSEWDSVFVFDESYVFRQYAKNHLYTSLTRASNQVTVCRNAG